MRIGVIGGGIGGLAAALSLLARGSTSTSTSGPALTEVGAGVQISPNASRVLHGLGLAVRWPELACGRWRGTSAAGTTGERCSALRSPNRSRPHSGFRTTRCTAPICLTRWPVRCRQPAAPWSPSRRRCRPWRSCGGAVRRTARGRGEVLVGADGIHSTVRESCLAGTQPRFTGCVAYRGLVPGSGCADSRSRFRLRSGWDRAGTSCTTSSVAPTRQLCRDRRAGHLDP